MDLVSNIISIRKNLYSDANKKYGDLGEFPSELVDRILNLDYIIFNRQGAVITSTNTETTLSYILRALN